jgi:hypothetical protein
MIQKAEDLRAVCKKIHNFAKPGNSSGLQTALVPVDHHDPTQATVWKKSMIPNRLSPSYKSGTRSTFVKPKGPHSPPGSLGRSRSMARVP